MDEKDLEKNIRYDADNTEKSALTVEEPRTATYTAERLYTAEDFFNWPEDERIELIDGKIYYLCAPTKKHQDLSMSLSLRFGIYLHGKSCRVYAAPFAVTFDFHSVLLPDIVIACNTDELEERGLKGVPDLVIEILSKSTASRDKVLKYNKYLAAGVKEYWLIDSVKEEIVVNLLRSGRYVARTYVKGDIIKVSVLDDLHINVSDLFEGYKGVEIVEVEAARAKEKVETIKRFLKMGLSHSEIAQGVGVEMDAVLKVCKEMDDLKI